MGLAFIYLALSTCLVVYFQKSCFHLINVFCVVIVVKNVLSRPGSLLLFCTAWQQDTFLVHTTKFTNLRSLLFRQPDVVNCVVRRVCLAIIAKLSQNRVTVVQLMHCGCQPLCPRRR